MEVENSTNAIRSLRYIKETLNLNPEIIVHDLSPNLIKATCDVFGYDKMAFDPFHILQYLNRSISHDLKMYRARTFINRKKDFFALRDFVSSLQKELKESSTFTTDPLTRVPNINSNHKEGNTCKELTNEILAIIKINEAKQFEIQLKNFILNLKANRDARSVEFAQLLEKHLPKRGLTSKGKIRLINELLKKLKHIFLLFRKPLEKEQKEFSKTRNVLFFQPENLTPEREVLLSSFLSKYPVLSKYRVLTLRVGSIYRLPLNQVNASLILDINIDEGYGPELKTCLNTFKDYYEAIFRFRDFFLSNPHLPRRSRANMEYQNRIVKKQFRSGLNLKSIGRLQNELRLNLGGEVRNFLKAL